MSVPVLQTHTIEESPEASTALTNSPYASAGSKPLISELRIATSIPE
jgi:hypothetical protein